MRSVRLALPICLAFAGLAEAQPVFTTVETLEWMVADSPLIVRASIVDFDRDELDTIVVRVRETIKGADRPFHTFAMRNYVYRRDVPHWKETGEDLLILFTDRAEGKDLAAYPFTPRMVSSGIQAIIPSRPRVKPAVPEKELHLAYTLDLRDPTDPVEILARVREAAKSPAGARPPRSHTFRWPAGAENIDRIAPVDGRLEEQARAWAKSKDIGLREEAGKALALFPSPENVLILKTLLADPAAEDEDRGGFGRAADIVRRYKIREAAFNALKAQGVIVPEPVLREGPPTPAPR